MNLLFNFKSLAKIVEKATIKKNVGLNNSAVTLGEMESCSRSKINRE